MKNAFKSRDNRKNHRKTNRKFRNNLLKKLKKLLTMMSFKQILFTKLKKQKFKHHNDHEIKYAINITKKLPINVLV